MKNWQSQNSCCDRFTTRYKFLAYTVSVISLLFFLMLNGCFIPTVRNSAKLLECTKEDINLAIEIVHFSNSKSEANGEGVFIKAGNNIFLKLLFCGYNKEEKTLIYNIFFPKGTEISFKPGEIVYFDAPFSYKFIKFVSIKEEYRDTFYQFLCTFELKNKFSIDIYVDKDSYRYFSLEKVNGGEPYILLKRKVDDKMLNAYKTASPPPPFGRDIEAVDYDYLYLETMLYRKPKRRDLSDIFLFSKIPLPVGGLSNVLLD